MFRRNLCTLLVAPLVVIVVSASLFLAGCSSQEPITQTDKEAAANAAKAPDRSAAPAAATKPKFQPPPP